MPRTAHKPAHIAVEPGPVPENHALAQTEAELREIGLNVAALADKIGYDGPLTLGGAEDHARMQMRRTVNECLELGKTLLVIRELTPHGGFKDRIEMLGIDFRTAQRFMQATLKFSKASSTTLLTAAGTQTKLLELLVLDDDEVKALGENGSVRGVSLDDVERMTTRELRDALRKTQADAEADLAAKDKLIQTQSENLQKLHRKVAEAERRQAAFTPEEARDYECAPLHDTINATMLALAQMATQIKRLTEEVGGGLVADECFHAVLLPIKRALEVAAHNGLHIDLATLTDESYDAPLDALQARAAGLGGEALQ